MSTRNFVPRADGEGNIGTSLKKWLKGWFGTIQTTSITNGTDSINVADIAAHSDIPTTPAQVGAAAASHSHAESDITNLATDLSAKAPLASPALTGTPTAPTADAATDTTQLATTAFVHDVVVAASDTVAGIVELATSTEVNSGSDTGRAISPDALAGSTIMGAKTAELVIVDAATSVTTSHVLNFYAPRAINGMNLVRATAYVDTAGTTNATTIQVRNLTKYSSNDALSTAISIASGGTVATAGTVNTSYDDVATDDKIKVYVTGVSTTAPKGLTVVLEYMLP